FYDKAEKLKAVVRRKGAAQAIPAVFRDVIVAINEPCKGQTGWCLNPDVLRRIANADELLLEGKTEEKKNDSILYSLRGYRPAIQEMNKICSAKTQWLVPQ